ncbi:lipase family protein [Paenibacillaceae bacterium]|nr:lipase family protein [Paenibacillaceae bacterium]
MKVGKQTMDTRAALLYAAICGQTYVQFENEHSMFLMPPGYELVEPIKASAYDGVESVFGFILESADGYVVAFRGTSTPVEWISNSIARQTSYRYIKNGGLVHQGFVDIYASARDQLIGALGRLPACKPVTVTGHSLGGALAVLAAPDIAVNTIHGPPQVYTYAAPRVGDPQFALRYNRLIPKSWRIYNEFDLVPYLPPHIYRSPRTDEIYYYLHVKKDYKLSFKAGSVSANHILRNYFLKLAELEPAFAEQLCAFPPGWCPTAG